MYRIEIYNNQKKKYEMVWEGAFHDRAKIMFNKPYYSRFTRRLIEIRTEIVSMAKANKSF